MQKVLLDSSLTRKKGGIFYFFFSSDPLVPFTILNVRFTGITTAQFWLSGSFRSSWINGQKEANSGNAISQSSDIQRSRERMRWE